MGGGGGGWGWAAALVGEGRPEGGVVRLCVSHLLNAVILPKVMTQPHWDSTPHSDVVNAKKHVDE